MSRFKNYILYAAVLATVGIQPSMADSLTENMFERKVFLEEFTTENCNNCPAASVKLHNILELPEYEGRPRTHLQRDKSGIRNDSLVRGGDMRGD